MDKLKAPHLARALWDGYDQGADRGHARPGVKVAALAPEIIVD